MRQVYPEKKIRNIVFRLIPNHGRQYPKEESVRQVDLDALQNHHDLLCTLYWAAPPSCRPSINTIRNLVNAESSHREACHISIKAWKHLLRFQLSTKEPAATLTAFGVWHNDLTSQLLHQRRHARIEAQLQFNSVMSGTRSIISSKLLESTIDQNQRQTEALLEDALTSMIAALKPARKDDAMELLHSASTSEMFALYDADKPRINRLIRYTLEVVRLFVQLLDGSKDRTGFQHASEDSQDYGEWVGLDEMAALEPDNNNSSVGRFSSMVHDCLAKLMSNAFGADAQPETLLMTDLVDTWVQVARLMVQKGLRQWHHYLDPHQRESWSSLRSTTQTRQYTTYFLWQFIVVDPQGYQVRRTLF